MWGVQERGEEGSLNKDWVIIVCFVIAQGIAQIIAQGIAQIIAQSIAQGIAQSIANTTGHILPAVTASRQPPVGRGASALGTGTEEVMEGAVITALYGIFQRRHSWECCIWAE